MVIMNAVTPMVLVMLAAAKWTGFTLAYLGLKPALRPTSPASPHTAAPHALQHQSFHTLQCNSLGSTLHFSDLNSYLPI